MRFRAMIVVLLLLATGAAFAACAQTDGGAATASPESVTTAAPESDTTSPALLPPISPSTVPRVTVTEVALPTLSIAPLNSAFLDSLVKPVVELWPPDVGRPLGLRPLTLDFSRLRGLSVPLLSEDTAESEASPPPASLPAAYDLRPRQKLTPVKDQNPYGTCWSFATLGSLESRLMPARQWDFSEDNMVLRSGFDHEGSAYDWGGNLQMSTAYLARWEGPVSEEDDPYGDDYNPPNLKPRLHVQSVKWLPARSHPLDNDNLKQAIRSFGGVYVGMCWQGAADGSTYFDPHNASYYYFGFSYANHAVLAVGWDDHYPAGNFVMPPPGNGAFIVKNSWGPGFGDEGFFYVSYYDNIFGRTDLMGVVSGAESPSNYDRVYQYDPLGQVGALGFDDPTAWFANVFTAAEDSFLHAVSFYTLAPGTRFVVYYGPDLGSLRPQAQGTLAYMGYHTVKLSEPVPLSSGQAFVIAVKLVSLGTDEPVAVEYPLRRFASAARADPGQSYISADGKDWTDVTVVWDPEANVCLKAFAKLTSK